VLKGRSYVSREDVEAVAAPVLRHRIRTNFTAEAEGVSPDEIVRRLIALTGQRTHEDHGREHFPEVFRPADAG
jgi:MoxR-like ATPase